MSQLYSLNWVLVSFALRYLLLRSIPIGLLMFLSLRQTKLNCYIAQDYYSQNVYERLIWTARSQIEIIQSLYELVMYLALVIKLVFQNRGSTPSQCTK